MAAVEPGWSVEKIKRMGADAVKLLAQFEPSEPISAEHQFQLIEHVYDECKKYDILLLLETVSFPFGGEKKTDASYLDRKAADGDRVGPAAQPVLRHLQGGVPRHARPRVGGAARGQPARPRRGQRAPLGAAVGGGRLPRLLQAGGDGDGVRRLGRARRPGVLEGVLPPGRRARRAPSSPRRRPASGWPTSTPWSGLTAPPGSPATASPRKSWPTIRAAEGWHARYGTHRPEAAGVEPGRAAPGEVY